MQTTHITSLSSKGQVVIPHTIRTSLGISVGSKLIIMTDGVNLLMKPVLKEKVSTFKNLVRRSRRFAKEQGLKKGHITNIIRKVRNENRP